MPSAKMVNQLYCGNAHYLPAHNEANKEYKLMFMEVKVTKN